MSSDEWVWPAYSYEQWAWSEMNGWYNPEDDPASPTETVLLDEIKRLRAENDDLRYELSLVAHERALTESEEARRER